MRRIYRHYLLLSLLSSALGCNHASEKPKEEFLYADIPGIIAIQEQKLTELNPTIEKKVQVATKSEKVIVKEVDWTKELTLFKELNLNKAAFKNQFLVRNETDSVTIYVAKEDDMLIRFVKIEKENETQNPRRISASWENKNILYTTSRVLSADFENGLLSKYTVETKQKLRFGKEQFLRIEGRMMKSQ